LRGHLLTDCVEKSPPDVVTNFLRTAGALLRLERIHSATFPYGLRGQHQAKLVIS
jgi:hypothetical protein